MDWVRRSAPVPGPPPQAQEREGSLPEAFERAMPFLKGNEVCACDTSLHVPFSLRESVQRSSCTPWSLLRDGTAVGELLDPRFLSSDERSYLSPPEGPQHHGVAL